MRYYHISLPDGTQLGPYDQATLQHMVMTGQIPRDCMAWTEGQGSWLPLEQVIHIPAAPPMAPNNPQHPIYTQYQEAMQGDAEAQYYLACCFLNGEHVQKDEAAAIPWLQAAAEQNHYKACVQLANCYGQGIGVKENPTAAVEWGKIAAGISNTKEVQDLLNTYTQKVKESTFTFWDFLSIVGMIMAIYGICTGNVFGKVKPQVVVACFLVIGMGLRGLAKLTK